VTPRPLPPPRATAADLTPPPPSPTSSTSSTSSSWFGSACPVCVLDSTPVAEPDHAEYLAARHDETWHDGWACAFITTTETTERNPR
jgi:hypothetical protein